MATINLPGAYPADAIRRASTGYIDPNDLPLATSGDFAAIYTGVKPSIASDFAPISGGNQQLGTPTVTLGTTTANSQVVNTSSVANATSYVYKYNTSNTQTGATTFYTGSALTATATGLAASTPYFYFVIPTATNYTSGTAGIAAASTPAAQGGGATPLAVDFNPASNLTRTGNNVAATSPGSAAGVSPLRLSAGAVGYVQFTAEAGPSAFLQLIPDSTLPTANLSGKYGLQRANNRGVAVFGGAYIQADGATATASAGTTLRMERESAGGGGFVLNWKALPVNGGANDWVTFHTEADDGSELRLAVYLPNEQLSINGIVTNGFV